jgi:DNA-binding transcriptional LysR family regulator
MYPGIELRLLRYVAVLAQELNFTRAATQLHVAQPSLSKQIRELEDYLGLKLFERTKREVRLTAAGEAFASQARHAILHAERAVLSARAAKGQDNGPWTIAYSPFIDLRILSSIRRHLSSANPAADIRFVSAFTSEQTDGLTRGKLQAGLLILPVRETRLSCEALYREPLVVGLPHRHPLVAKPQVEIADLDEMPLVTIRGDIEPRFGEDLLRILSMVRVRPRIFHRATTPAEAFEVAAQNEAAALTMPSAHDPAGYGIVFRKFRDEFLTADTALAYPSDSTSPILISLRKFLCEAFQPFAPGRFPDGRAGQMELF